MAVASQTVRQHRQARGNWRRNGLAHPLLLGAQRSDPCRGEATPYARIARATARTEPPVRDAVPGRTVGRRASHRIGWTEIASASS